MRNRQRGPKIKAQSIAELALLMSVAAMAIFGMQIYTQRSYMAKQKDAVKYFAGEFGCPTQYEPYYNAQGSSIMTTKSTEGTYTRTSNQDTGKVSISGKERNRTGTEMISSANAD